MRHLVNKFSFVRSVMAGFFSGIIAAVVSVVFVFVYRSITGADAYYFSISPLLIYVGIPILLSLSGMLLFVVTWYVRKGITWYTVFFILLAIIGIAASLSYPLGDQPGAARGLLIGLIVINGIAAAWLLPYLARHPGLFMTGLGRGA